MVGRTQTIRNLGNNRKENKNRERQRRHHNILKERFEECGRTRERNPDNKTSGESLQLFN